MSKDSSPTELAEALGEACPELVGQVIAEDGRRLQESYTFNLNGTSFVDDEPVRLTRGIRSSYSRARREAERAMFGYHGRALVVNLTDQEGPMDPIDESVLRRFIGGLGLGSYLLYTYCPPGVQSLGPDNPLIFVCSPLVGTRLTTSSKFGVVTKSPLTGFSATPCPPASWPQS